MYSVCSSLHVTLLLLKLSVYHVYNPHTTSLTGLSSLLSGSSLQSSLVSKLRQFSVNSLTSELAQSFSSDPEALRKKSAFSSLSGDLSFQWVSKCPTPGDFTLTADQFRVLLARPACFIADLASCFLKLCFAT